MKYQKQWSNPVYDTSCCRFLQYLFNKELTHKNATLCDLSSDYRSWRDVLIALNTSGCSSAMADKFSRLSAGYDENEFKYKWQSICDKKYANHAS